MHTLARDGSKRARLVNALLQNPERLIGAILLGNNLVNILASVLATSLMLSLFGESGVVYATLTMTALAKKRPKLPRMAVKRVLRAKKA